MKQKEMRYEGNSALLNTVGIFYFYGIRHDLKLKMAKKKLMLVSKLQDLHSCHFALFYWKLNERENLFLL